MNKQVGPKKAREMWFLARFYTASEADKMGLVNVVVPVSSFHWLHYKFTCSSFTFRGKTDVDESELQNLAWIIL